MSKNRKPPRGKCPSGKRRWRDHAEAIKATARLRTEGELARVYYHEACNGWHATSAASYEVGASARPPKADRAPRRRR